MNAIAYIVLQNLIVVNHGKDSLLSKAIGKDFKGKISMIFYIVGIAASLYFPMISGCLYIVVAFLWLVPDKRIEHILDNENNQH